VLQCVVVCYSLLRTVHARSSMMDGSWRAKRPAQLFAVTTHPCETGNITNETWLMNLWDMTHCKRNCLPLLHTPVRATRRVHLWPWLTHLCDMTHCKRNCLRLLHTPVRRAISRMRHDSWICETWLPHLCDMTHCKRNCLRLLHTPVRRAISRMRHDSRICETWLPHLCDMTHCKRNCLLLLHTSARHDSFIYEQDSISMCAMTPSKRTCSLLLHTPCEPGNITNETWLMNLRDMIHEFVRHDSFICVTWLIVRNLLHICMCDMTRSCVSHASFMCETWLLRLWDMTHSCVWRDSFMCDTWLIVRNCLPLLHTRYYTPVTTHLCIRSHNWKSHATQMIESYGVATVSRIDKIIGLFW